MLELWIFTLMLNIPSWACGTLDQKANPDCGKFDIVFSAQTEKGCEGIRKPLLKELKGYTVRYEIVPKEGCVKKP